MANSLRNYTGDGTTTDFLFDVPYIKEADVSATVEEVATSVTFVDPTHVRILPAPLNGDTVVILRTTNNAAATFTFPDLTYLKSRNLDGDFLQQLYLHQEVEDLFEITGLENVVVLDGSNIMTGSLKIGDGSSRSGITLNEGDHGTFLHFRNQSQIPIAKLSRETGINDNLRLETFDPAVPQTAETVVEFAEGNISLSGSAVNEPTAPTHLIRKDWLESYAYSKAASEATLGNPASNGLALVSQTDGTRSWASLLGGGDFLADGTVDMTGDFTLRAALPTVTISSNTAGVGSLEFQNTGFFKTGVIASNDTEMTVNRHTNTGSLLTTLALTTDGNVNVNGIVPTADNQLTRRDYVNTLHANRNVIINGNFDIWQRGTNFAAHPNSKFSADRYSYHKAGTMVHTTSRSADVPAYAQSGTKSNYSIQLDVTTADVTIAAGDYCFISYRIEGYDYARLQGEDATLSFWVKGAKTGVHCVSFRNSDVSKSYVKEYTIASANTWEKVELTVPLTETGGTWDYSNGSGLELGFALAAGSTFQTTKDAWQTGNYLGTANQVNEVDNDANYFKIAQVQFERGSTATPLECKSISDELARCQRYYQHLLQTDTFVDGYNAGGANFTMLVTYPVAMRDNPTLDAPITSTGAVNLTTINVSSMSTTGLSIRPVLTATGRGYTTLSDLKLDAEL